MYSFDTAWSPPIPVVLEMIYKYPDLKFSLYYEEPGCNFQGDLDGEYGKVTRNICEEFHPECMSCGTRDYIVDECEYEDVECGFLCPECYIKENQLNEWDGETNE